MASVASLATGGKRLSDDALFGSPCRWSTRQWKSAFAYFRWFYHPGGLYAVFFTGQKRVTLEEFKQHLLADYAAAARSRWEWATTERERVRDRILVARGREPIDGPPRQLSLFDDTPAEGTTHD